MDRQIHRISAGSGDPAGADCGVLSIAHCSQKRIGQLGDFGIGRVGDIGRPQFASPGVDRHFVLLAESAGELVGFVCVLLDKEPRWVNSTEPGWGLHLWVLAANLDARRFYQALGGEFVERRQKRVAEGVTIPSVRYVWPDLTEI